MIAIGFLSYMVWGHHMFLSGMNPFSALVFSFPTLIITIPATIITMIWIGSIYGANLRFHTPALFSLGFISVFVAGGVSGFFLAQPSLDIYLHGTYFVVGHFHMVMGVAAIFGILAGTYFWFPKMSGRMMNDTLGKIHFWFTFIGVYCIFIEGKWKNVDPDTRGLTTLDITVDGDRVKVHAWGKCHPTDCDWGVVDATALVNKPAGMLS